MGRRPKGKSGGKKSPRGASGAGGGGRGFLAALKGWTVCVLVSGLVGGALGGGLVLGGMYRHALAVVDAKDGERPWSVPGKVLSGAMEVWPGLELTAEQLGDDLQAAGYARVTRVSQAGDFASTADAVTVKLRDATGLGWQTKAATLTVRFSEGRVSEVTGKRAVFAPMTLATVRGPDNEERSPVALEAIPKHVRQAVLAMEDARFYEHPGIDALGIGRAVFANLTAGEWVQGGSSITQQLAKNLFLSAERTAARKVQEALLALALERTYTKDQILQLYLNEIYLGQAAGGAVCGVDAASRAYFGKPVGRVSVAEGAVLGGIISSPNPYSPIRHPDKARERRDLALRRMTEMGWLDAATAEKARAAPVVTHADLAGRRAPWAVDRALEETEALVGEGEVARQALVLQTSIVPALQRVAEGAVRDGIAEVIKKYPRLDEVQAALAVVDARTGAIVALVGGRDWASSAWDRASHAERQVGSTVKPLTMLAAFSADDALSPATLFEDTPITRTHDGKTWSPQNYDGAFVGPIPLRTMIATSRNVPAVLLAERVGLDALRDRLHAVGLAHASNYPSTALGSFEASPVALAGAYSVFVNGTWHAPWLLRGVLRGDERLQDSPPRVADIRFSARATFLARDVLREVLDTGTGKAATTYGVGKGAAGKSGTTDGTVDAWFAGVTGNYAVAAWVGFDKQRETGLTGGQAALPLWARFVARSGTDDARPAVPESVVRAEVCEATGRPACGEPCALAREEWFSVGTVPTCDGELGPGRSDAPREADLDRGAPPLATPRRGKEAGKGKPRNGWQKLGDWLGLD